LQLLKQTAGKDLALKNAEIGIKTLLADLQSAYMDSIPREFNRLASNGKTMARIFESLDITLNSLLKEDAEENIIEFLEDTLKERDYYYKTGEDALKYLLKVDPTLDKAFDACSDWGTGASDSLVLANTLYHRNMLDRMSGTYDGHKFKSPIALTINSVMGSLSFLVSDTIVDINAIEDEGDKDKTAKSLEKVLSRLGVLNHKYIKDVLKGID